MVDVSVIRVNDELEEQVIEEQDKTQQFDDKLMVEGLLLPTNGKVYPIPLYSKLYFLKNFELIGELGVGNHVVGDWRNQVEESAGNGDYFNLFKIDTKPTNVETKHSKKVLTYYEKEYGVNFKLKIVYNYSFRIADAMLFLENVCQYQHEYKIKTLYRYIEDEINDTFLSFISKSLLDKKISILNFNSHILEFSENFTKYCNTIVFETSGISIIDFNFAHLEFVEDTTFLNIKGILYDKSDMKLRNYTWKQKSKYDILEQQKAKQEEDQK